MTDDSTTASGSAGESTARLLRRHFSADPALQQRYNALRKRNGVLHLSQYDLSDRCNLRCEGCLYFAGSENDDIEATSDLAQVDAFFAAEAARGINYVEIGGAEPALVQDKLAIAARHIPQGVVYTNGSIRIRADIPYRLHISLWGLPDDSRVFRGADVVHKALRNYRDDPRAVFVLTVNARNLASLSDVVKLCAEHGARLTFSHYSPTSEYLSRLANNTASGEFFRLVGDDQPLVLSNDDLRRAQDTIGCLIDDHPDTVVYSHAYNQWIHNPDGLYQLEPATGWAVDCGSRTTSIFRHFGADLQDAGDTKCCTPNIDCRHCRLYAQSWASLLQRFPHFVRSREGLAHWMEFWELWSCLFLPNTEVI